MLKALAFGLCLLGAAVYAAEEVVPSGKTLPLFSVVTFPNDVCDGSKRNGTCFTSEECTTRGGTSDGSCANGFGVCCVFELACGETSSANNTYLVQASVTTLTSPCKYTICKASSDICRIRFDFTSLTLASTPVGTATAVGSGASATATLGGAIGHCVQDQFSISSPSGGSPVICGSNTGQHMIVDADDGCHMASFLIGSATSTSRVWDIFVTQFNCGEDDTNRGGPPGCLQYFTATTGYVRSYAFPTSGTDIGSTVTHLANQQYTACIRRASASCFICYTPIGTTSTTASQSTFGVSIGPTAGTVQGGVNTFCATDYVQFAGGAASPGSLATTTGTKVCGRFFASVAAATAHATVCTRQSPYRIAVNFDEIEIATITAASMTTLNEANGLPSGIIGFGLVYTQGTTGC